MQASTSVSPPKGEAPAVPVDPAVPAPPAAWFPPLPAAPTAEPAAPPLPAVIATLPAAPGLVLLSVAGEQALAPSAAAKLPSVIAQRLAARGPSPFNRPMALDSTLALQRMSPMINGFLHGRTRHRAP